MSRNQQKTSPKTRRGNSVFIGAWVPEGMAEAVDIAVTVLDLDRSKFLRRALEEKVSRAAAKKGDGQ